MWAVFCDEDHFFQTHAAAAADTLHPNQRLDGKYHARPEYIGRRARQGLADIGGLIGADSNSMPDEQRKEAAAQTVLIGSLDHCISDCYPFHYGMQMFMRSLGATAPGRARTGNQGPP